MLEVGFLNYLTLWGGCRSDGGGYCEYEENDFGVDVHVHSLEREEMRELSLAQLSLKPPFL